MQNTNNIYHKNFFSLEDINSELPNDFPEGQKTLTDQNYTNYLSKLSEYLYRPEEVNYEAGRCRERGGRKMENLLYRIVKNSVNKHKDDKSIIAAANAITILKAMDASLSMLDLRKVQIPNADLSGAILDGADLSKAYLENVDFTNASLNGTVLYKANLTGVELGVRNLIDTSSEIRAFTVSPNGKFFIIRSIDRIQVWNIEHRQKIREEKWETNSRMSHLVCIDDKFFIVGDKKGIYICSIDTLEKIEIIRKDNIRPGASSYLNFALSPDRKLLVIAKPHENFTEISVRQLERKEGGIPTFSKIIQRITEPYHIDKLFFLEQDQTLITIKRVSKENEIQNAIQFRYWETLRVKEEILYKDQITLCDVINNRTIIFLINNTLHTISLNQDNTEVDQHGISITPILKETHRLRSLRCSSKSDYIAYIKDNIDAYPSIYVCDLSSTDHTWYYVDAFDYQIDDIHISEDGSLLFQILYKTGRIYIQSIDSIIQQNKTNITNPEAVSHVCFSRDGGEVIALGNSNKVEFHSITRYNALKGPALYTSEKIKRIVEEENKKNEVSAVSYSLFEGFVAQRKKVLHELSQGQSLQALQDQFQLLSLNDTATDKKDMFEYAATMALSHNSEFSSFIKNDQLEIWDIYGKQLCICDNDMLKLGFDIKEIKILAISPKFSRDGGHIACTNGEQVVLVQLVLVQHLGSIGKLLDSIVKNIEHSDNQIFDLKFTQHEHRLIVVGKDSTLIHGIGNNYTQACTISKYVDKEKLDVEDILEDKPPTYDVSPHGEYFLTCHQGDKIITDKRRLYFEEKYNILRFIDIKSGRKICKKEIIPGPIGLKFSSNNKLFVTWLWKGDSIQMWHYSDYMVRLLWRSRSNLEAHKLDITEAIGLSNHARERLIYAGAVDRAQ